MVLFRTGPLSPVVCIFSADRSWAWETFYSIYLECNSTKQASHWVPRNASVLILKDLSFVHGVFCPWCLFGSVFVCLFVTLFLVVLLFRKAGWICFTYLSTNIDRVPTLCRHCVGSEGMTGWIRVCPGCPSLAACVLLYDVDVLLMSSAARVACGVIFTFTQRSEMLTLSTPLNIYLLNHAYPRDDGKEPPMSPSYHMPDTVRDF